MKYPNPWTRPDLIDVAQTRTKQFIKKIAQLIKKNNFDIILAPGNSGIMMAKITEMIYDYLEIKKPKIIKIPLNLRDRVGKMIKFDNSVLVSFIKREITYLQKVDKILYVDDDVGENSPTFRTTVKLFLESAKDLIQSKSIIYIVAEDFGFSKKPVTSNRFKIKFFRSAKETKEWKGISNFVSYGIPWNIQERIRKFYSDKVICSKELFCILLKEPIRDFKDETPILSHKWEPILKREIKDFEIMQESFENHIKNLIKNSINA